MALPDRDALEGVRALSANAPQPIVMFSDKDDPAFVEDAIAAGVCSYNLSGVSNRDMKAIVASAVALFRRYSRVESERFRRAARAAAIPAFGLTGSGTVLTLAEILSYAGDFGEGKGAALSISKDDTLSLTGTSSFAGWKQWNPVRCYDFF